MPLPGAGAHNHHSSRLHCAVRFTGSLQVLPSSVLLTTRNWEVCLTPKPGWDPFVRHWWFHTVLVSVRCSTHSPASLITPCIHKPAIYIASEFLSTNIQASDTPLNFWGRPPHSPISIAIRSGSQVCPPSVLRCKPMSISPCRSRRLSYRASKIASNVPF